MTVIYDREYKIILCIMRDVTEEYKIKEKKEAVKTSGENSKEKVKKETKKSGTFDNIIGWIKEFI